MAKKKAKTIEAPEHLELTEWQREQIPQLETTLSGEESNAPDAPPAPNALVTLAYYDQKADAMREQRIAEGAHPVSRSRLRAAWPMLFKCALFRPNPVPIRRDRRGEPEPHHFAFDGGKATVWYHLAELGIPARDVILHLYRHAAEIIESGRELLDYEWIETTEADILCAVGRSRSSNKNGDDLRHQMRSAGLTEVFLQTRQPLPGWNVAYARFRLLGDVVGVRGRYGKTRIEIPGVVLKSMKAGMITTVDLWALDCLQGNQLAEWLYTYVWDRILIENYAPITMPELAFSGVRAPRYRNSSGYMYTDWARYQQRLSRAMQLVAGLPNALGGGVAKCVRRWHLVGKGANAVIDISPSITARAPMAGDGGSPGHQLDLFGGMGAERIAEEARRWKAKLRRGREPLGRF